ncbi:MAG: hypothetical protein U9P44_03490 [archaeon]|nr:hypothetical protein [archaeon]
MKNTIAFQDELSYPGFEIKNHKDYFEYRRLIERIDEILKQTKMDLHFADEYIDKALESGKKTPSPDQITRMIRIAIQAYRCTLLGVLIGKSYREQSILIAESFLLQRFCMVARIDGEIKIPTKSTLQRYAKFFDEGFIREQVTLLNKHAFDPSNVFGLCDQLEAKDIFVDATCMKARIHFPVDWVLIKDCVLTILKAILVIRKHGLKHRIKTPEIFISELNALCMSMTSLARQSKKKRKAAFRKLKKLAKIIRSHGRRYSDLLMEYREEKTDLSEAEANCILKRLEKMIMLLPEAVEQANTRIISGGQVENEDKLISVYHENVNVIKRGKAGGQVEFGNTLFLSEQANGIIVDWQLYQTDVKEPQATKESIIKMTDELEFDIASMTGDRGCQSKPNDKLLEKKGIYNGLCPRNPLEYAERMQEGKFRIFQKRRGQTEGRIGIVKNAILDGSLYEREIEGKQLKIGWAILVHNLWCLARLPAEEEDLEKAA